MPRPTNSMEMPTDAHIVDMLEIFDINVPHARNRIENWLISHNLYISEIEQIDLYLLAVKNKQNIYNLIEPLKRVDRARYDQLCQALGPVCTEQHFDEIRRCFWEGRVREFTEVIVRLNSKAKDHPEQPTWRLVKRGEEGSYELVRLDEKSVDDDKGADRKALQYKDRQLAKNKRQHNAVEQQSGWQPEIKALKNYEERVQEFQRNTVVSMANQAEQQRRVNCRFIEDQLKNAKAKGLPTDELERQLQYWQR